MSLFTPSSPEARLQQGFLQATSYLNNQLTEGERILYRAHLSWVPVFIRQIPFLLGGGALGGILWGVTGNFLLGLVVYIAASAVGVLSQAGTIYHNVCVDIVLTNRGIRTKRGLVLVKDDTFAMWNKIDSIDGDYNTWFERIFTYGDVELRTIGGNNNYNFKHVARSKTLKNAVREAQYKYGGGNFGIGGPMSGAMPMPMGQSDPFPDSEASSSMNGKKKKRRKKKGDE